ncbi:MAG: hypothetical protein R3E66_17670 [bacterium]
MRSTPFAVLLFSFALACGSDDNPSVTPDTGGDASTDASADLGGADAGEDAAPDAAGDVGSDAQADAEADVPNTPPVANAGMDQTGVFKKEVVFLGAGFSSDPDGDTLTYTWTQTQGAPVVLDTPNEVTTSFTAVSPSGIYAFQVEVSDGRASATDTVTVEVINRIPTPDAGIYQKVQPGQLVTLDASQSIDGDDEPLTYSWSQFSGEPVTLSDTTAVKPTFTAPAVFGELVFEVEVSDGEDTATARVQVDVENLAPLAEAGPNQIAAKGQLVTLDGTGSSDPEGQPITYSWTQVSGPETVTLSDPTAAQPTFTTPAVAGGTFIFELVVNDGVQDSTPDRTRVVTPNSPPVADAGADLEVNGGEVAYLDGSLSADPDGDSIRYTWTQLTGTPVDFGNGDRARAYFKVPANLTETLTFQLTVANGQGSDSDTVSVSTRAWAGTPAQIPTNPFGTFLQSFTNYYAIDVSGTHLAIASNAAQIQIWDIADRDNPALSAELAGTSADSVLLDGATVFVGTNGKLSVLNFTRTALSEIGSVSVPNGFNRIVSMSKDGDTLYGILFNSMSGVKGIVAFDVQTLTAPTVLHSMPVTEGTNVAAGPGGVWMGGFNTMTFFDTSTIRSGSPAFTALTDASDDRCSATTRSMQVVGTKLYAACTTYADVAVFDITTPASPVMLGNLKIVGAGDDIAVSGSTAYVAAGSNGVLKFDVSNPATPVFIGSVATTASSDSVRFEPAGQTLVSRSVTGIDLLSDELRTPEFAYSQTLVGDIQNLVFVGGRVAVSAAEISLLDVRDLNNVTTLSTISEFASGGLAVNFPYLFASSSAGIAVVDIQIPTSPLKLTTIQDNLSYEQVQSAGDRLYATARTGGVLIYDISNPNTPSVVSTFVTGDDYRYLLVDGSYLYAIARVDGLHVLDIGDEMNPMEVAFRAVSSPTGTLSKSGDVLWHAFGANSLFRFNVSDPANPVLGVGTLDTDVKDVVVNGALAWIAAGPSGLLTLDVSDVANPILLERYDVDGESKRVALGNNTVWFGDDNTLRAASLDNASTTRQQTATGGTSLVYPVSWQQPAADAEVKCYVSGGTCTVGAINAVNRTADVTWNLPATGDHEIAVIVGHPATRTYLRDRISVVP